MANHFRILSIDGGGIRGILPGQLMVALEKKLQEKSRNANARIADYFDMIAGTSTGGILTCLYLCPDSQDPLRPMFSAIQAVDLYLKYGKEIFKDNIRLKLQSLGGLTNEKYSVDFLEDLLKKYFKDTKLSQLLRPCLIPSYNIYARTTHFFTQHDAKASPGYDYALRDVARATSAAPTYFEPAHVYSLSGVSYPLVDGGVFANNPALCAYAEARHKYGSAGKNVTAADMFMVSIGTGSQKRAYEYNKAKDWGAIGWVQPVLDIMMSGASDTVDFQLQQIFQSDDSRQNYIRINPEIGEAEPEMDNASLENMQALKEAGIACSEKQNDKLEFIADYLINSSVVSV
ncbi:MAG: patatin-like phospholipase family protein [Bacteroidetes bacterium]|nr:patatin-like phospholipase family protein [Bacteroidota bacterium]